MVPSLRGLAPFQFALSSSRWTVRASMPTGWRSGARAFQHVGYVVRSLEQTTAEMDAAGHPVVARIHSFGADQDGAAAYYDTADRLGFLVEAVEPPARMPAPDFTMCNRA